MKTRWLICSLLMALSVPEGANAQKGTGGSPGTGPVIQVPVTTHDFGEVFRQEKFVHAFVVRNVGNADLVIEEVKPG